MSILKIEPAIANSSANFAFGNVFASNFYYANGALFSGGGSGTVKYTTATTPPSANNSPGDQWFNTTSQVLYEYINDGTGNYWVDILSPTISSTASTIMKNGNSNVSIQTNGNLSISVSGTSNVLVVSNNSAIISGGVISSNGLYSTNNYTGTFSDGIVVDYVTGIGRISVGASDGISFYKNGVADTQLMSIDSNGNASITGTISAVSVTVSNGFYSTTNYTGTFTDGIVVDYVAGTGRISVGSADGIGFYKNGVAGSQLMGIDSNGNTSITGSLSVAGATLLSGATTIQLTSEIYSVKSGATGAVLHDLSVGGTFYHTSPAANFTVNFTNVPTTDARIIVSSLIIQQGATPYIPNAVQIAGVAQTIKWLNGTAPSGNGSKIDIFTFSLMRNVTSWVVFGQSAMYN